MVKKRYRWQAEKATDRRCGEYTMAGPCTTLDVDGNVVRIEEAKRPNDIVPQVRRRSSETGGRRRRLLVARFKSRCNDCGKWIEEGDSYGWNPVLRQGFCSGCVNRNPNLVTTRGRNRTKP